MTHMNGGQDSAQLVHSILEMATFDDLMHALNRRYPHIAVVGQGPQHENGQFDEIMHFQGQYNVVMGLLDTLHYAVLSQKAQVTKVMTEVSETAGG